MKPLPYPQPILIRLSDVSDVSANTAHRSAYVTTTLPAIVQGLRNLECQPDPFNEFQGPDALFSRLLAGLAGSAEYDAVMGNEVERLNALLAEQVLANDALRRERGEARLTLPGLTDSEAEAIANLFSIETNKYTVFRIWAITQDRAAHATPTPGAQP